MEDEIDLRIYVEALFRYWPWIAGLTLVAAIAAFVVSLLLPATYEASAVVLVTEPRYQMQFDPRFGTEERSPAYRAFPTLATSDGILQSVINAHAPSAEADIDKWTLRTLSEMVEASSEGDPSLVVLAVRSRSPQDAATIANLWADALVQKGNHIYGESEQDVTFFEEQVAQARLALDKADAALIEFEARNQANIVSAQLDSQLQTQADYLADQRTIAYILQDIEGLREQLAEQPDRESVSLGDSLTALLLQIKAFDAEAATPVQLQIGDGVSLSDKDPTEQVAFLDDLVATLEAKAAEIDARLTELEPRVLASQRKLQEVNVEGDRLVRTRDLTEETYVTLVRKRDEARIAAQEAHGMLQVGSYAGVPERPSSPRKLLNTAIAGTLGLLVGVFGVFLVELWRQGKPPAQGEKE
jgi:succinoglycan biosynthesis transport protein ExoP